MDAVNALAQAFAALRAATDDATRAATALTGARAARAGELAEIAAEATRFCEKLLFACRADVQSDDHQRGRDAERLTVRAAWSELPDVTS